MGRPCRASRSTGCTSCSSCGRRPCGVRGWRWKRRIRPVSPWTIRPAPATPHARALGGPRTCARVGTGRWGACGYGRSWGSTTSGIAPTWDRWLSTPRIGAIMSRLRAGTCMWDSRWVRENSRRPLTEVGMMHWARWSAAVAVAALVAAPLCGQGSGGAADPLPGAPPHAVVTNDMLLNAAASGDWLMYGHNYWNNRFSPLKTINTANVKNLVPRAVYTHGSERLGSFETTPVVVAGVMYITSPATPNNIVRAFDLRTQKMLWEYTHKNDPVATACCGPNKRGVAVSGGLGFLGTLDDNLVALDATTGKVKWQGKGGDGPAAGHTETMAPLVIGDNVTIGTSGAAYGIRRPPKALSAANRAAASTRYTPPRPPPGRWWGKWSKTTWEGDDLKRDIAKEKADSAKYADAWKTGGGSMW